MALLIALFFLFTKLHINNAKVIACECPDHFISGLNVDELPLDHERHFHLTTDLLFLKRARMEDLVETGSASGCDPPGIWNLFTSWPPIQDDFTTETSELHDETIQECLPFLNASTGPLFDHKEHGLPSLARDKHIRFLRGSLEAMPAAFVGFDASRPWIVYWALTALRLLGEDVEEYRERVTQTFSSMQNDSGGFGGGHGQISHCAPSYAVVLSLALIGGTDCLDLIDRKALWHWLGQIKQQDGGFRVCVGGEEDVRGGYCAMVMISLLGLPLSLPSDAPARRGGLESFVDGLPGYLSRCQTFEGGISGSPQTEAHGAYAFCALACLGILGPPHEIIPK
ncbi:MAG: hypothetical protein Q9216_004933 [Gyalolechia sp. 2 TL-2023]